VDSRTTTNGSEEKQKELEDKAKPLDPRTFDEWMERVSTVAKQICNDPDGKRIQVVKTGLIKYDFPSDNESIDCIIQSIRQQFNSMSPPQQKFFKEIMTGLEAKKEKNEFESRS
jgi:hypothetical protein